MHQPTDSSDPHSVHRIVDDLLGERIEALAGWIQELDAQVRATAVAGDKETLKELRRALEAWSKRDPKFEERLTNRVDVLADRLTTLSSTVNTTAAAIAGTEGELAALRRQLEEGAARIEGALAQPSSVGNVELEQLRRRVATLSEQRARPGERRADGLSEKLDNLSERLDTLAKTVATTAAGLAGREGELASLRRSLEDEHGLVEGVVAHLRESAHPADEKLKARIVELAARVEAVATGVTTGRKETAAVRAGLEEQRAAAAAATSELRGAFEALTSQVASLEEATRRTDRADALEERLASVQGMVDELGTRLESVATTTAATSSNFAVQELELATLHRQLAEASARVDGALDELRQTLDALPDPAAAANEVRDSVGELARRVEGLESSSRADDALAHRVEGEVSGLGTRLEELASRTDAGAAEIRTSLEVLSSKLAELEADRGTEATDALRRRLESTVTNVVDLSAQLRDVAGDAASATAAAREHSAALAELRGHVSDTGTRFERRLTVLQEAVEAAPDPTTLVAELQVRIEEATTRVDTLSKNLEEVAARPLATSPSEDRELKRLLVAFADRIEAMEEDRARIADDAAASAAAELEQLADVVEGLGARLAASEELIASLTARDLGVAVEGLATRLDALERAARKPPAAASGDGRFRVELRALELRAEHAEVAARESREAVLVELERLAASVEERLQRLERAGAEPGDPKSPALGEVVPLRSGAET